jgi:hypothetical protein
LHLAWILLPDTRTEVIFRVIFSVNRNVTMKPPVWLSYTNKKCFKKRRLSRENSAE